MAKIVVKKSRTSTMSKKHGNKPVGVMVKKPAKNKIAIKKV